MDFQQRMNQQIGRKLLAYNDDLNRKRKNHHLEYFSWVAIGCMVAYVALQIIRCVGR